MNGKGKTEIQFMGKITAGVTHEMKNVLAIIKESAGLMEDLLSLSKDTPIPHRDKFARMLSNIREQVGRGVDLAGKLNLFAHSSDQASAHVDLHDAVDQIVLLAQRFAKIKGISLVARPGEQPVVVVTNPLRLHMLIFDAIEMLLRIVRPKSIIGIRSSALEAGCAEVAFSLERTEEPPATRPAASPETPGWSSLQGNAQDLGASLEPGHAAILCSLIFKPELNRPQ